MKKIFTLLAVAAMAVSANAEGRSWNFTSWSAETVANLKADANWSDIEKATASEPTEASKDNCFWEVDAAADVNADGNLVANGVVIAETKGLKFINTNNRSLAIAVNYPSPDAGSDFGPYNGPAYLWLGSKNIEYFVIPAVEPGTTIKMGVESHKITDARGVQLLIDGAAIEGPDAPLTYQEQTWTVPATLAAPADVTVKNTNGCHIYFIQVGESASLTEVAAENAPAVYYNLQGVQVENPANGLYIRRQGNTATKVYVK